jgi:hypothetical protein
VELKLRGDFSDVLGAMPTPQAQQRARRAARSLEVSAAIGNGSFSSRIGVGGGSFDASGSFDGGHGHVDHADELACGASLVYRARGGGGQDGPACAAHLARLADHRPAAAAQLLHAMARRSGCGVAGGGAGGVLDHLKPAALAALLQRLLPGPDDEAGTGAALATANGANEDAAAGAAEAAAVLALLSAERRAAPFGLLPLRAQVSLLAAMPLQRRRELLVRQAPI